MSFSGQSYVITGASSGIGKACAQRFVSAGARVALIGRNQEKLERLKNELDGEVLAISCNLESEEDTELIFRKVAERFGKLNGVVLSAGTHAVRPASLTKAQHFLEMFTANVITATNAARSFVKHAAADSSIVFLSSAAAISATPGAMSYSAAKGALLSVVRCLALELVQKRIRVNAIVPGVVSTPMTEGFFSKLPAAQIEGIVKAHPLGLGTPDDVAGAIAFLCSHEAKWITGTQLVVDGGLTCS